ncbi:energy transducer TonB [Parabacteroides sp. APC149_11_2_Y6]
MKIKNILFLLSFICLPEVASGESSVLLLGPAPEMKERVKPYLDSLCIDEPLKGSNEPTIFKMDATFPAGDRDWETDAVNEGTFSVVTIPNELRSGIISDPVPLLDNARIRLTYFLVNGDKEEVKLSDKYRFTQEEKKDRAGSMIHQRLYLTLADKCHFQDIKIGFIEMELFSSEDESVSGSELYLLGRRIISFEKGADGLYYATYMQKDSEGGYSPVDYRDGADFTFPEFKGGRYAMANFFNDAMVYPKDASELKNGETILVACTIGADGSVSDVDVITNGADASLKEEAKRLVYLSEGNWVPAKKNGENIAYRKFIPVVFNPDNAWVAERHAGKKNKKIFFILGAVALFIAYMAVRHRINKKKYEQIKAAKVKPTVPEPNDKMVIIVGADRRQVEEYVSEFCDLYNEMEYVAVINLHQIKDKVFALTCPYDMEFCIFYWLVDHLFNMDDEEHSPKVMAWLTLPAENDADYSMKHAMLYRKENCDDYSTSVTTIDNQGYMIEVGDDRLIRVDPVLEYSEPPFSYEEISRHEWQEIS